ncbi:MAG TPA: hydroxymethylglutaryl-CoA lyase [Acidimicrobiia bacterium]
MSVVPTKVVVTESSSRDGLQSLGAFVATADKIGLIESLAGTGITIFDAVSFVSPRAVPQMADGAEVIAGIKDRDGLELIGLVPNMKGFEAATAAGVDTIAVLTAASDTFNQKNINATVDESMHRIRRVLLEVQIGTGARAYISTATHCPFEGEQDPDWVAHLVETLLEWGAEAVFLGDTVGMATPAHMERLFEHVLKVATPDQIGVHFHDTYGQGLANTMVALEHGISRMDTSAGGLGGCPYAPGATGNLATEDLLYLLDGLGIEHGIDIGAVARASSDFCSAHGLDYNSRAGRAWLAARGGK